MARPRKVTTERVQNEARALLLVLLEASRREVQTLHTGGQCPSAAMVSACTSLLKLADVQPEKDNKQLEKLRDGLAAKPARQQQQDTKASLLELYQHEATTNE